jgi:hypothetical protein
MKNNENDFKVVFSRIGTAEKSARRIFPKPAKSYCKILWTAGRLPLDLKATEKPTGPFHPSDFNISKYFLPR